MYARDKSNGEDIEDVPEENTFCTKSELTESSSNIKFYTKRKNVEKTILSSITKIIKKSNQI